MPVKRAIAVIAALWLLLDVDAADSAGRICPAIPKSAKECPMKKISDPEFEPVCVVRSEAAELQRRRCMPGEKAPYYKDSQGVFRCACCGAPLWLPSKQFDQLPASSWPWPSFHSSPINGDDGLPNVCHRGPGYGVFQRNATTDLGPNATGEVGCARCGIHLGDYFNDKDDGHDHYCIDGVCMEAPGGKPSSTCAPTIPGAVPSITI
jgi:peptide methionine sulfoxide reductase MsrB